MWLFYDVTAGLEAAKATVRSGIQGEPKHYPGYPGSEPKENPIGVWLTDDPILSYEHCGCEVICVELACSLEDLAPYEDPECYGASSHIGDLLEQAWFEHQVPLIGTTHRDWFVPVDWLHAHTVRLELFEGLPDDLWRAVARWRRPGPRAHLDDPVEKRMAALARVLHGRAYDGKRYDEDKRPGTIALQESTAVAHFDRLVSTLVKLDIPLARCGWLLAEAARRVAIDSAQLAEEHRQGRAARWKTVDAEARDDAEVKAEAQRLYAEGVPVAHIRRRLTARYGSKRVPSIVVLRRRWLRGVYRRDR